MLFDYNLLFATADQTITADAASTDTLTLPVATDLGSGERLLVFIKFGTNTNTAALTIKLEGADDTAFSGGDLITVSSITLLAPVSDSIVAFPIRSHVPKKCFRLYYDGTFSSDQFVVTKQGIIKDSQIKPYSRVY